MIDALQVSSTCQRVPPSRGTVCYTMAQSEQKFSFLIEVLPVPDKQLNVWIPEDLRNYVAERAEHENSTMTKIIIELIRQDMARHHGELIEQNSLVILREIVAAEMRQAHAQLRRDLRDVRTSEAEMHRD